MVSIVQRRSATMREIDIRMLGERVRGDLPRPGSKGYDTARGLLNAQSLTRLRQVV